MPNVLVVGSVALDTIETPYGKRESILGGSAVHFSLSARHFAPVRLVGVVGRDFPQEHVELLKKSGVDTAGLTTEEGETFRWHGRYEGAMNAAITVSVHLNVFEKFQPRLPEGYRGSEVVLLGNGSPHTQRATFEQLDRPHFVLLDTMNLWIEREREALVDLIRRVDGICINADEARMLAGTPHLAAAMRKLVEMGVKTLIVKQAEYGAAISMKEGTFAVPAYPTEQVADPTGAGDSFAGGFLGYIASHGSGFASQKRALLHGAVMGSLAVEDFGVERVLSATPKEIAERVERLTRMISLQ